jgi:hypothetical protein
VLRSVALQGTIRDTTVYWERQLAASSDVTKPTNVTGCKETRSTALTATGKIERSAPKLGPHRNAFRNALGNNVSYMKNL